MVSMSDSRLRPNPDKTIEFLRQIGGRALPWSFPAG
jgi:hypothetical protein